MGHSKAAYNHLKGSKKDDGTMKLILKDKKPHMVAWETQQILGKMLSRECQCSTGPVTQGECELSVFRDLQEMAEQSYT